MSTTKKEVTKKAAPKAAVEKKASVNTVEKSTVSTINQRKTAVGIVVSDKMQKTIVVKLDRRVRHDLYKKYLTKSRKFKAHDEKNEAKVGDLVSIIESRPLSREKRWALQKIVRRAVQTAEANI